jgi:hypothetical protein
VTTEVLITVDTEFSIAGAFRDPEHRRPVGEPAVLGEINGRSHGLGFLLETLGRARLEATFFVETFNVHYFGDDCMGRLARRIRDHGHDVQLHIHPCWSVFRDPNWRERLGGSPPDDSMADRTPEAVTSLVTEGADVVERWGLPRPVALRTGSLRVDRAVYSGLARAGLDLASNVGLAIYRPADPELQLLGGRRRVDGVLEVPVLGYRDIALPGLDHVKNLTITGCSWAEIRWLLNAARRRGVGTVVVLTHPFEFFKYDESFSRLRPNRVNQRRFRALCEFLARHADGFEATTFGARRDRWLEQDDEPAPDLRTPPWLTAGRLIVNKLNEAS